jgi:hypothetical protein
VKCQFEEKQYEQHLNNELLHRKQLLYVPGQVLEGRLGFDAALYSRNRAFWRLFDVPPFFPWFDGLWIASNRPGVQLCREWWSHLDQSLPYFPRFKFNVFVQHKRPEYLTISSANEWSHWNRPYFRFELTPHQQKALEQLESHAQNRAIVVYGSPAFVELAELWSAINDQKLIERSNFCQPSKLSGHHAYTFADPGRIGKAHSDTEDIESFDFYEQFNVLNAATDKGEDNIEYIIRTGNEVQASIQDCGDLTDAFTTVLNTFNIKEDDKNRLPFALAKISVFNFVAGTTWSIAIQQ